MPKSYLTQLRYIKPLGGDNMSAFKKATWYCMEGKSTLSVYLWYRKQFFGKTKDQIFGWQVEPGTKGEKAQADSLGVSLATLEAAKAARDALKAKAWSKVLENANRNIIAVIG